LNIIPCRIRPNLTKSWALFTALMLFMNVQAGQEIPDSLQAMLDRAKSDSARISVHIRIANALTTSNYQKALEHATLAVELSEKTGNHSASIESYKLAGSIIYAGSGRHWYQQPKCFSKTSNRCGSFIGCKRITPTENQPVCSQSDRAIYVNACTRHSHL